MRDDVQKYYGETLKSSGDLQTSACCTIEAPPLYIRNLLAQIHDEPLMKYYGCGLVVPEKLDGLHVLDLGCGAGRDCFMLSALVGEHGSVTGIDMTPQQLNIARKYVDYHTDKWGYKSPNIKFLEADIDKLRDANLPKNSFDLIISNCVINLCQNKFEVLKEAYELLKPGGEMYFSDVYASRRIPVELVNDPVLYGECLSGALYWNDFINISKRAGFLDPRLVTDQPITIENPELKGKTASIDFFSATYRLFKIPKLEPSCEDYGQAVIYKGDIDHFPQKLMLDKHHSIEAKKVYPVCGNTFRMLHETRFKPHFDFIGDWKTHYGIFEGCGQQSPFEQRNNFSNNDCC